jgi:hypothetical protein
MLVGLYQEYQGNRLWPKNIILFLSFPLVNNSRFFSIGAKISVCKYIFLGYKILVKFQYWCQKNLKIAICKYILPGINSGEISVLVQKPLKDVC